MAPLLSMTRVKNKTKSLTEPGSTHSPSFQIAAPPPTFGARKVAETTASNSSTPNMLHYTPFGGFGSTSVQPSTLFGAASSSMTTTVSAPTASPLAQVLTTTSFGSRFSSSGGLFGGKPTQGTPSGASLFGSQSRPT